MIEKVAIAVNERLLEISRDSQPIEYHIMRGLSLDLARLAIEAMREPDIEMRKAAYDVPPTRAQVGGAKASKLLQFKAQWTAAIDAALSPSAEQEGN